MDHFISARPRNCLNLSLKYKNKQLAKVGKLVDQQFSGGMLRLDDVTLLFSRRIFFVFKFTFSVNYPLYQMYRVSNVSCIKCINCINL